MPNIILEQFGFRSQLNTTLLLINVLDNINTGLNLRYKIAAVLLDIQKAFDKIWRNGLIFKLLEMDISIQLVNTIRSFQKDTTFRVKIEDKTLTSRKIEARVPQRSCLSPHQFSVYINDIPVTNKSRIVLFANDIIFYSTNMKIITTIKNLQTQINVQLYHGPKNVKS